MSKILLGIGTALIAYVEGVNPEWAPVFYHWAAIAFEVVVGLTVFVRVLERLVEATPWHWDNVALMHTQNAMEHVVKFLEPFTLKAGSRR